MVINLPDKAKISMFKDDEGIIREGFIMPDGSPYMIDKYGITKPVTSRPIPKEKFGELLNKQNIEPKKMVPPDGAERAWFDDNGTMREGYILPDGSMYMLDKYGLITKVITNSSFHKTKFKESLTEQDEYFDSNGPYTPLTPINNVKDIERHVNVPILVIGIIFVLCGLILAFIGFSSYQYYQSVGGQMVLSIENAGYGNTQSYQDSIYMMIGGIVSFIIGLLCIISSN
jgi:hypothetical protein